MANTNTSKVIAANAMYRTVISNVQKIGEKHYAYIPRELLCVDKDYQRVETRSNRRISDLAHNWNDKKMDSLRVVPHPDEGKFYIVDGYGRFIASSMLQQPKMELNCEIDFDAPEDPEARKIYEAKLFAEQSKDVELIRPAQIHKANVLLGDKTATILDRVCKEYGVRISAKTGTRSAGTLGSYSDCYKLVKAIGEENFRMVFDTICALGWNEERNGYSKCTVAGIGRNINKATDKTHTQNVIVKHLRGATPEILRAMAITRYPQRYDVVATTLYIEDFIRQG